MSPFTSDVSLLSTIGSSIPVVATETAALFCVAAACISRPFKGLTSPPKELYYNARLGLGATARGVGLAVAVAAIAVGSRMAGVDFSNLPVSPALFAVNSLGSVAREVSSDLFVPFAFLVGLRLGYKTGRTGLRQTLYDADARAKLQPKNEMPVDSGALTPSPQTPTAAPPGKASAPSFQS